MKIFYLLSAALLLGAGSLSAQSKIDARGRQLLDLYKAGQLTLDDSKAFLATPASRSAVAMTDVMVETTDAGVLDSLRSCGYNVEYISPNFSLVCMPTDDIEALAASPVVKTLSFGHVSEPMMDEARAASNVNGVHSGLGIAYQGDRRHSFRGNNVIVGMFDTGFDPGHVNFLDADGKNCRIKFYARFTGSSTTPTIYQGDQVRTAPTDDSDETHGTHVAGIMGGAYNGAGTYYKKDASGVVSNAGKLPLYGVAPDADLAICAGPLYNNSIIAGIRRLINYANSVGKPIVINLSLGHNTGPHDGTDSFSRQLDDLAKEAIICVAAGNEGADNTHAGTTFTASKKDLKVAFSGNRFPRQIVDVWSSTTAEIKVSIILATSSGEIVAKISSENGRTITVGNGEGEAHSIFRQAYNGNIALTALRDGNRYNVSVSATSDVTAQSGNNYVLGLMIEGEEGVRVDAYGNSYVNFTSNAPTGFDRPDNNGSISGLACGHNTIIVGAYSSRAQYIDLTGASRSTGGGNGNLASYSSWGELIDGRKLPHITAPGTGIISSYNGYYARSNYDGVKYMLCAVAEEGGQKHYWGSMNGTSMATPYVTGSVGLWLEADKDLTGEKAREIMIATAKTESGMDGVTAWGAGKIQVLNGIKEVIAQMGSGSGVADITTDEYKVLVTSDGLSVEVVAPSDDVSAELYNIGGNKVAEAYGNNSSVTLEAPSAGIYIVNVRAGSTNYTTKVALR